MGDAPESHQSLTAESLITGKAWRQILYSNFETRQAVLRGQPIYMASCRDCGQLFDVARPDLNGTVAAAPLLPLLAHRATHAPTAPPPPEPDAR
jgi:hypothetical protein